MDYKNTLRDQTATRIEMRRIQSDGHKISTVVTNKIGLCGTDDKRFVLDNGEDTLAHGHFEVRNHLENEPPLPPPPSPQPHDDADEPEEVVDELEEVLWDLVTGIDPSIQRPTRPVPPEDDGLEEVLQYLLDS